MRSKLASLRRGDAGMTTSEYAVGTVAACGLAGGLYEIVTSDSILGLLADVVRKALTSIF